MTIRILNTTLLVITLIGVVFAYRASQEYRQVLTAHRRLDALVGLPIHDPSKVHVRAIATGEGLRFSWRVYIPAGMDVRWKDNYFSEPWVPDGSEREFIAAVRLSGGSGGLSVHSWDNAACHGNHIGEADLAELLRSHRDEIQVEQLGSDGVAVVEADELATLLRLTLPEDLQEEAEQGVLFHWREHVQEALLLVKLGSAEAFRLAEAGE